MQGVVPCIKSILACSSDESKTARRHTTIFTAQWNVFSARARRGRSEHDWFHASEVEGQVDPVLFSFDNGVSTSWASSEVPRSPTSYGLLAYERVQSPRNAWDPPKSNWPGICRSHQLIPRFFVCSAARQGTAVDVDSLAPQGLLSTLVSLLLFLGGNRPRTSALQRNPRTNTNQWCTNMMAVKMMGLGMNFFSVCPTLNGAGLHIL